jgi:hypothetical protein
MQIRPGDRRRHGKAIGNGSHEPLVTPMVRRSRAVVKTPRKPEVVATSWSHPGNGTPSMVPSFPTSLSAPQDHGVANEPSRRNIYRLTSTIEHTGNVVRGEYT